MGRLELTVAYAYTSLQITDAVRERGRRMAILVCLPGLADVDIQVFSGQNQSFGSTDKP
jgi:hypothetical protein